MDTLGRHLIAEYYGCSAAVLDDLPTIRLAVHEAAHAIGATVLHVTAHRYAPQGVTATVLIAESHLSVHTWPEHGYAAVDIFTCGDLDPRAGFRLLRDTLQAQQTRVQIILRGIDDHVSRSGPVKPEDVQHFSSIAPLIDEL